MKAQQAVAALRNLRERPLWRLLGANQGPVIVGVLQAHLLASDKSLPSSILHERLSRDLEVLREDGEDLPQSAQQYLADWLSQGYVSRRFPVGAVEEEYELTAEAASAIRFILSVLQPRSTATESRLATVIQQLSRLADETNTDPTTRLRALQTERERIDREIDAISRGEVKTLPADRALERAREVIGLADELTGDFRRVRDDFAQLNRQLREMLMEHDGSRGEVLEMLFGGVDVIAQSEAGKTFYAFWTLLTDREASASLSESLDEVLSRPFARKLGPAERKFLRNLTNALLDEGSGVHEVLQAFARSLKSFVQSREYLEHRRLNSLLKAAMTTAMHARDFKAVAPPKRLAFTLGLTGAMIASGSQWYLYDPGDRIVDSTMAATPASTITLDEVNQLVQGSEIDMRTLKENVRLALASRGQVSVAELLTQFPAEQGLGSVIGYISLGAKHGYVAGEPVRVGWMGQDDVYRHATVPSLIFVKERLHEFID